MSEMANSNAEGEVKSYWTYQHACSDEYLQHHQTSMPLDRSIKVMVSSAVYGVEELLDQIYALLSTLGYTVWMSHTGTVPLTSHMSNLDNCLAAVENCDVFVGIITKRYGSGLEEPHELAITHREIRRAIELNKKRFFAVHSNITLARQLLRQFRIDEAGNRRPHTFYQKTAILDDIRILDMYDEVIQHGVPVNERTGNWAQEYTTTSELLRFITAQFSDPERIRRVIGREE